MEQYPNKPFSEIVSASSRVGVEMRKRLVMREPYLTFCIPFQSHSIPQAKILKRRFRARPEEKIFHWQTKAEEGKVDFVGWIKPYLADDDSLFARATRKQKEGVAKSEAQIASIDGNMAGKKTIGRDAVKAQQNDSAAHKLQQTDQLEKSGKVPDMQKSFIKSSKPQKISTPPKSQSQTVIKQPESILLLGKPKHKQHIGGLNGKAVAVGNEQKAAGNADQIKKKDGASVRKRKGAQDHSKEDNNEKPLKKRRAKKVSSLGAL